MTDSPHEEISGLGANPDAAPLSDYERLPRYLWTFAQHQTELARAAEQLSSWLGEVAKDASIAVHFIEARPKGLTSFADKAATVEGGALKYTQPLQEIYDCIAARVIVFTTRARNELAELITLGSYLHERKNPGDTKYNGYDSEHLVITGIKSEDVLNRHDALNWFFENYRGLEIQIRSVAGHGWAEFEHGSRYKSAAFHALSKDNRDQIDQWFIEAGGMRRVMDELFDKIEAILLPNAGDETSPSTQMEVPREIENAADDAQPTDQVPLESRSLREFIRQRFTGLEVGSDAAIDRLVAHFAKIDIHSINELESRLELVGPGQVGQLMDYPSKTSGARRLDDEMLALFTDRYVETEGDEGEQALLRLRLRRVRGKFAIYTIDGGDGPGPLTTAAGAVRILARIVAEIEGLEATLVRDSISLPEQELLPSAKAKLITTERGRLWVATNLSRLSAENVMKELVERVRTAHVEVRRAGDLLCSSGAAEVER